MITYQSELMREIRAELEPILPLHWAEIACDKDIIKLNFDWDRYFLMEDNGMLSLLTCRVDGKLVGYHITFVMSHFHYKDTLHGFVDIYYLLSEYRKGRIGINLFREAEKALVKRGVVKVYTATKSHMDMSAIFERLGWRLNEYQYAKILKDSN